MPLKSKQSAHLIDARGAAQKTVKSKLEKLESEKLRNELELVKKVLESKNMQIATMKRKMTAMSRVIQSLRQSQRFWYNKSFQLKYSNSFCLFCTATKKRLNDPAEPRTFNSAFRRGNRAYFPALSVSIDDAVPSTLHIFLGIATEYFKNIENLAKKIDVNIYDEIQTLLSKYRLDKQAWYMTFTGNQVHKLIGSNIILSQLQDLFPSSHMLFPDVCRNINLLQALGQIQIYAKAQFLSDAEQFLLFKSIHDFKEMLFSTENPHITPKMHWLFVHVEEFVKRHGFWGLASEQPIENLHSKINENARTFAPIVEQEALFRQFARIQASRNFSFDNKS
ncbi:hypothetical protein Ddc_20965 [Ditylenchus destructor]|nr:hypothetical protein Ddc_20965 [Ditylenchus destructor]